jgi:ABC-type multidrug transport system fused ATPase/permease subunit
MPTQSNHDFVPPKLTVIKDRRLLWRSFGYLRPYWKITAGVYATMVLINLVTVLVPQIIRWSIDEGIYGGNLDYLGRAIVLLLGITLVKGVLTFYQGQWTEIASQHVAYDLRNEILTKLARLPFAYHDRTETGQILSRATQDVERIRFLTGRAILRLLEGSVLLLFTAVTLLAMNTPLALLIIPALPLLLHRAYVFGRRFRPLSFAIQDQLGVLTTQLEQNLRGARIVKAFGQETAEIRRFDAENERWFAMSAESARVQAVNAPMLDMIANFGTVVIFWYGGRLVIQQELTLGELVAFTTYLAMLLRPINLIGRIIPILALAASAAERIFAILDTRTDIEDRPDAVPAPRLAGRVRFEDVSFVYDRGRTVLHDINFEAQPGQIVALIGATGSGKSSLINLVARFYEPSSGRVAVDGFDTRSLTLHSLRSQISFVMQDTILFATSIRENITFGRPEASEGEVIQAAKDAQAHEFISAMPQGYDTLVGERGVTLSGGQKQRLAIARALLNDPRILILDDATASVDSKTEQLIQLALDRLMVGRTTFVIAHRLSTVRRADLILVLESGRIAARGTHEELLATSTLYQRVYQLQVRPEEESRR